MVITGQTTYKAEDEEVVGTTQDERKCWKEVRECR